VGCDVKEVTGVSILAGIADERSSSAINAGHARMESVYGVSSTVYMAKPSATCTTGEMTNAYAVYAKIDDQGNLISGDKYAIYAEGKSRLNGDVTVPDGDVAVSSGSLTVSGSIDKARVPFRFERAEAFLADTDGEVLCNGMDRNYNAVMPWAGKVVGWSVGYDVTADNGSYFSFVVTKNGSSLWVTEVSDTVANSKTAYGTDSYPSSYSFSAGDTIGAAFGTGIGTVGMVDAMATIFVVFDY
jgi:hypothetical protein